MPLMFSTICPSKKLTPSTGTAWRNLSEAKSVSSRLDLCSLSDCPSADEHQCSQVQDSAFSSVDAAAPDHW
jgi:hypothetical protein